MSVALMNSRSRAACPSRADCPARPRLSLSALMVSIGMAFVVGCAAPTREKVQLFNDDGVNMFNRGNFVSARESFSIALELAPQDPELMYNLAQCNDRIGDLATAEQYYAQCLNLQAGHIEARYSIAMIYYKTGRIADFNSLLEDWFHTRPRDATPYVLDGWRLRQERNYPQAQGRFQQALGLDPNNLHALVELGILYELMQMPERSLTLYERALAKNPNQPEVLERVRRLRTQQVGAARPVE